MRIEFAAAGVQGRPSSLRIRLVDALPEILARVEIPRAAEPSRGLPGAFPEAWKSHERVVVMNDLARLDARSFHSRLGDLLRTELVALGAFLTALAEFDRRRLFRDLGYASFFDYEAARSSIAGLSRAVADGSHRVALFGPAGDFTNSEFSQSTIRARQAQGVESVDGPQSNTRGHRPLR